MPPDPAARIRRFHRAVTREAGALDASFLGRGRPLGVARVLWQIPRQSGDLTAIRAGLGLDSGQFSRILRSLEREGLITLARHEGDGRRRLARLTGAGADEVALYNRLSDDSAKGLVAAAPNSAVFLAAMDLIATVLNRGQTEVRLADPDDPAAQACLQAYFDLLVAQIDGMRHDHLPLPDPHADRYRPPNGAFLIAWSDDLAIGCVSLRTLVPGLGEVKRLWVAPDARGQGLARRLMLAVEEQARKLGMTQLKLDTNAGLTDAIALYQKTGWSPTQAYSGFPSTHWFAKSL